LTGLAVWLVLTLASKAFFFFWFAAALYLTFAIFCLKDLRNHVERVEKALNEADLEGARRSLSWIVGRDTANLTPEGIRRATVETIAENFSDGLVAPLLYLAFGGPVLAWIYKAVNTLDSMVGYKNEQYFFLGRFSARLDDLANFIPSRLAALLLVAAAKILHLNATLAFRLWRLEGRFHSSPNSGQTEAAMAGALNVFLGGPNYYSGQLIDKPAINRDGTSATKESVQSAMNMVEVASILALVMAVIIETALLFFFEIPCGWGLSF
jgi:adenosylcobinamide-phosphate synthase